ncbi:MAG: helix-turn-helix domain-containing protein [Chloroflexales bacterium]
MAADLSNLQPYELGETGDPRAVPYLIRFLYRGGPNERRLAASAITKLTADHREVCALAAVALLDCLDDPAPQVRLYALKALAALPIPPEADPILARVRDEDEKPYNRDAAQAVMHRHNIDGNDRPAIGTPPAAPEANALPERGPAVAEPAQAPSPHATPAALAALNRLLEAAYGEPRRLSDLLRDAGLDDGALATLRRERLADYLDLLAQQLRAWLQRLVDERTADVFIRRFELDGRPAPTLESLGRQYGVSRERIRQLEVKVLKRLRSRRARGALEQMIADAAREILSLAPAGSPLPADSAPGSSAASALPRSAGPSALATLARFEAGLAPTQIAAERGLAEGTIYAHLAACIRSGSVAANRVVTGEMVEMVRAVMGDDTPPVSFTELRQRLPAPFTYGHVLCVIAGHPELLPETRALTAEEVRRARAAIRSLVSDCSGELPRSGVIKILVGSGSKRVADQRDHPAYGALVGFDHAALWQIIDDLITAGEIALDEHSRVVYVGASAPQSAAQ